MPQRDRKRPSVHVSAGTPPRGRAYDILSILTNGKAFSFAPAQPHFNRRHRLAL
jgi:hypothetical protein